MIPKALPWSKATFKIDSFVALLDSACTKKTCLHVNKSMTANKLHFYSFVVADPKMHGIKEYSNPNESDTPRS